jgi:predicted RNA binding protein YcfA (HicA-like mRNA interferase family)
LKSISGKEFARILECYGWKLVRTSGSHYIYMKSGHKERISVPIHGNESLKIGLLKHCMKIAGIQEKDI